MASHIVGGEFELLYLGNNQYRLNLIYYFDLNNNTFAVPPQNAIPENQEATIDVVIFRKSDNFQMRTVKLTFASRTRVNYTQPDCSKGEILTDKLIYTTVITLPDAQFNSPSGYYIVWERCCRNYTLTNIVSQQPPPNNPSFPNAAGQTFYLEFPPVVKNGITFKNSSPKLFPPLNDYACPRKPYYADFAGTDEDGDSLVYTLATPLSTHTSEATPIIRPAPFPEVRWQPPFNFSNMVGGNPDLKISSDGFLTVTPTTQGLYVFAVKCEEYRDGTKIGEVRRDFQMLVVDACPRAEAPQILGKTSGQSAFTFDENMSVSFSNTVSDENRCVQVQVSDPDASNADDNFRETVSIRAIALNFKKNVADILPEITNAVLTNGSTKTFDICFDKCPPFEGGPFQVGIVAYDDACSLPLSDTLKITVHLTPPVNHKPRFVQSNVNLLVQEGSAKRTFQIDAVDEDGDIMDMFVLPEPGFTFANAGMTYRQIGQVGDTLKAEFTWDPNCSIYDFTRKTEFNIKFVVEDRDDCKFKNPATLSYKLRITLPGNADPVISTDLSTKELQDGITRKVFESIKFNVSGSDADNDKLVLVGQGNVFNLSDYGMVFPGDTDKGNVSSDFTWNIACPEVNLNVKDKFQVAFILIDSANKCKQLKTDTLTVNIKVDPPENQRPLFTITNTNTELPFINNHQSLAVGQQISLALISTDEDQQPQDHIRIEMIGAEGNVQPEGYIFAPAEGIGMAQTTFVWNTECSMFKDGNFENNFTFTFTTRDDRCFNPKSDTLQVDLTITDVASNDSEFIPPNIITPNGDTHNEFFAMVREDAATRALVSILPPDNCIGRFVSISIFNRWGKELFKSDSRDFKWYPNNSEAAGVYFYTLKYSHKEYKGTITLMN